MPKFCFGSVGGGGEGRDKGIPKCIPKSLFCTGREGRGRGHLVLIPKSRFCTSGEGRDGGDPVLMPKFCISSVGDGDEGKGRNKGVLACMLMFCFGAGDGKSVWFMQKSW